ncbi:hypothetical protein NA57DRAFT_51347 [Rhizodiscina lignyota]|uniref:Uncharacterized protein n=1 Tax=Rhizodiscina lignyota TaxID=1504668 RepID=A0A9P4IN11_9PEZI|nr:hypothetical protein NA57DRAFT_51347 [Rhizodiscina lignyota]
MQTSRTSEKRVSSTPDRRPKIESRKAERTLDSHKQPRLAVECSNVARLPCASTREAPRAGAWKARRRSAAGKATLHTSTVSQTGEQYGSLNWARMIARMARMEEQSAACTLRRTAARAHRAWELGLLGSIAAAIALSPPLSLSLLLTLALCRASSIGVRELIKPLRRLSSAPRRSPPRHDGADAIAHLLHALASPRALRLAWRRLAEAHEAGWWASRTRPERRRSLRASCLASSSTARPPPAPAVRRQLAVCLDAPPVFSTPPRQSIGCVPTPVPIPSIPKRAQVPVLPAIRASAAAHSYRWRWPVRLPSHNDYQLALPDAVASRPKRPVHCETRRSETSPPQTPSLAAFFSPPYHHHCCPSPPPRPLERLHASLHAVALVFPEPPICDAPPTRPLTRPFIATIERNHRNHSRRRQPHALLTQRRN